MHKLPLSFYRQANVVAVARGLLGQVLHTVDVDGAHTAGTIVETEAYAGPNDRACHAYGHRRTARTETMYCAGGVAYVYLCYGIHHMLNVVTHQAEEPYAVLIRAITPLIGLDHMLQRRGMQQPLPRLTAGPGALSAALGINRADDGADLRGTRIWIEKAQPIAASSIVCSPRVGVGYAGPHAQWPYRFRIKGNKWTSPAK